MIRNSVTKILSILLIIGLNWAGLSAVGQTFAYFFDNEDSNANTFRAAILDLSLRSGQNNFISPAENMKPGNSTARDIYVGKTDNSLPLKHRVSYEFVSGSEDFCNQLQLKIWYNHYFGPVSGGYANRDMRLKYNGQLNSLTDLTDVDFIIPHPDDQFDTNPSDGTEQWFYYSIILPSTVADSLQGEVCNFKFVLEAWQTNLPDSSGGFTDTEEIENTIKAGYWNPPVVLNEFLPNAGNYPEFIELYNKTASPIDLNGFYIKANNNIIPINANTTSKYSGGSTIIPGNGWLVVTTGGDFISNSSGTIALYNGNDVLVDLYTYGSPDHNVNNTPGWTNNLVAYWPFDNDLGDKSGNGNNGTNYGATFTTGKINQTLSFDGNDNVVVSGASSLNPSKVTLETWVKNSGTPGTYKYITDKHYLGDRGSYALYTSGSGGLRFYIGHTAGFVASPDAGTGIWDGNWHHIVGTYDGSKVQLYVDGTEIGSGTATTVTIAYNSNSLYIGSYGNGFYFSGLIDEVKIYNRALNATEISEHYSDIGSSGVVPSDKSYARIPDGDDNWVDPYPTPGAPNQLNKEEITEELTDKLVEEPVEELVEEPIIEEEPIEEILVIEEESTEEEVTTEENQEEGIIDKINEAIDEIVDGIVEEILSDEATNEEPAIEEMPVIDETSVIEEVPNTEETIIEETPATEEQPVIGPDNDSSGQVLPIDATTGDTREANNGSDGASTDTVVAADTGSSGESAVVE